MNRTLFSFLITFFAGITTLIGLLPIYIKRFNTSKIISSSLAFSAGVMISISIFSLIPESSLLIRNEIKYFPTILIVMIFVVIGICFSDKIDRKIEEKISNNNLYKLGIISIIVLILHNIPEGITTFISTKANVSLGLSLSIGIALHNIPEGISIAVPIYYSTKNRKKAILYTLISGFSEFLGAVIAYLFLAKYINNLLLGIILAITAGIMLHISIYELLPNSFSYKMRKFTYFFFIIGFIVMIICDTLI